MESVYMQRFMRGNLRYDIFLVDCLICISIKVQQVVLLPHSSNEPGSILTLDVAVSKVNLTVQGSINDAIVMSTQ